MFPKFLSAPSYFGSEAVDEFIGRFSEMCTSVNYADNSGVRLTSRQQTFKDVSYGVKKEWSIIHATPHPIGTLLVQSSVNIIAAHPVTSNHLAELMNNRELVEVVLKTRAKIHERQIHNHLELHCKRKNYK